MTNITLADYLELMEAWGEDEKILIVHCGCVGDTGEMYEIELYPFQRVEKEMKELADEHLAGGYKKLDEEDYIQVYPSEEAFNLL
ncbi:hypothetical protein P3S71_13650 [Bacillus mobilis]|nr:MULTISPECIES: hypothetical protein [Bacillus cereus group]MCU5593249.1 hypothetical protein [Bacillus mobilis]MCU5735994.1 hypothetical protein [Bacillus mobilis]MCU9560636.1 hypothetical protein [Bacillus mobilis]SCB94637.1 Protein of unknown function [Bacillus mobilis]SME17942.1 hypothetical protein BACERE00177_03135 [Bacillus mobilis]